MSGRPVVLSGAASDRTGPAADGEPASSGAGRRLRLVGLYGLEWSGDDGRITVEPEADRWRPVVAEVAAAASDAPPGVLVEPKGLAVTVHWRRAPEAGDWVAVELRRPRSERSGLRAHPGRLSVELRPPLDIDKGSVVRRLDRGVRGGLLLR